MVDTGCMEGEGEEFEWGGLKLADLERSSRYGMETNEHVSREPETPYENEASQLSEATLQRMKQVVTKVGVIICHADNSAKHAGNSVWHVLTFCKQIALGPLREILKAYFEPKVERALAYRKSRHRCRAALSSKRAKPTSSEEGFVRRLMHRRSSATELRGAEWMVDCCRRAHSFTRRDGSHPPERAHSWPVQIPPRTLENKHSSAEACGADSTTCGVGPISVSDGEAIAEAGATEAKREAMGKSDKPISFPRPRVGVLSLSYLHLVYSVIRLNTEVSQLSRASKTIDNCQETREFAKHFLPCLIEMFFVYKWCTLLHNLVK